ncbi:MAG: hypothetical protein IJA36_07905 [Lachnospiraceae bacterium]|nr:hypothetical protein [Lachnospiraceae bacterium]
MYNNFSSKKTKKVISALLASALVVTAAPITADAATTKVLGVNKTFSVSKKASAKVSGLSKAEKKIVNVTISKNKKKVTVKGKKAGSATFKVGSKSYTVRVTKVTSIKKKTFATTLTAKKNKNVSVTVNGTNVKYDKATWTSSNKNVVKVASATTKISSKKVASNTLKPLKKGTATITVKSKATGKSLKVKVTVKAATTATTAPTTTPSVTPATTPAVSATPDATASATPATTPAVSATPDATASATPATTPAVSATPEASASATPATTPAVSATPDVSTSPAVSGAPDVSTNPAVSATPDVSTNPAVSASPEASETPATVVSATAITGTAVGASKLQVVFDQPVATGSAVFTVKVGSIEKSVTSKSWTDEKTAVLTMNEKLTENTYSIVVSGVAEDNLATTVIAEDEKATRLCIDDTKLALTGFEGSFAASVRNQYDEKMSVTGIIATGYNMTQGVNDVITVINDTANTINFGGTKTAIGDTVRVTLTYGNLEVVTGTLEVVTGKTAADVSFGTFEKTTNIDEAKLMNEDKFKLPIQILDQYDQAITLSDESWVREEGAEDADNYTSTKVVLTNGTIITSSDASVVDLTKVEVKDGIPTFTANYGGEAGSATAKTATINVLTPSTGKSVSYTVNTYAARVATTLTGFNTKGASQLKSEKTVTENQTLTITSADFTYADQYGDNYELATDEVPAIIIKDTLSDTTEGDAPTLAKNGAVHVKSSDAITTSITFTSDLTSATILAAKEGTEKVTFTLGSKTLTTTLNVNAAVTAVVAKKDSKTKYTAGDEVTITLTAQKDTTVNGDTVKSTNTAYNATDYIAFTTKKAKDGEPVKTYNKEVVFVNGVATVSIPLTKTEETTITIGNIAEQTVNALEDLTVVAGSFSKYAATVSDGGVTLTPNDKNGNATTTTVSSKLVNVSAVDKDGKTVEVEGLDENKYVVADVDANGVVTLTGVTGISATNVITVVIDGASYTATVEAAE